MKMKDIGEKKFIEKLLTQLEVHKTFINGFGHDASVIDIGLEKDIVLKIDRAASPIASKKGWSDYKLWGRLAVTSNCSDILACGGVPKGVMMAMCLPREWDVKKGEQIVLGAIEECKTNDIAYLGGDTKETSDSNVVGCAVGWIDKGSHLNRCAAKVGDYIVVAGDLGGYMGAYVQLNELNLSNIQKSAVPKSLLEYLIYPKAKWREAEFIRINRLAIAGMDTSDGLYDALVSMGSNNINAELYLDDLPFHKNAKTCAEKYKIDIYNLAFTVGDWNILYTIPHEKIDLFRKLCNKANKMKLRIIGRWTSNKQITGLNYKGQKFLINGIINEHFRSRMEDTGDYMKLINSNISLTPL